MAGSMSLPSMVITASFGNAEIISDIILYAVSFVRRLFERKIFSMLVNLRIESGSVVSLLSESFKILIFVNLPIARGISSISLPWKERKVNEVMYSISGGNVSNLFWLRESVCNFNFPKFEGSLLI